MQLAVRPRAEPRRSLPHIPTLVRLPSTTRSMLDRPVLMLNVDYRPLTCWPLSVKPVSEAIAVVLKGKATIVEDWGDMIRSARLSMPVPKVIALNEYVPVWNTPKPTRLNIYLRDRFRCQYCGHNFETEALTYDHVIPRSKGGKTEWTNILSACHGCNQTKRDQDANYSGRKGVRRSDGRLRPLREPRCPSTAELLKAAREFMPENLMREFGDYLYWSAELDP